MPSAVFSESVDNYSDEVVLGTDGENKVGGLCLEARTRGKMWLHSYPKHRRRMIRRLVNNVVNSHSAIDGSWNCHFSLTFLADLCQDRVQLNPHIENNDSIEGTETAA